MLAPYPNYTASGLPWAPQIPEGWQVLRNGRLFSHRVETGYPGLPILEVSLRTGVRVRDMVNGKRKQVMSAKEKYKRAVKGDIAYNMMRMWQGAVGPAPVDGLVSPAYVVVKPHEGVSSAYFSYLFRTAAYMQEVNKFSRGIVADRNRLYWETFKQMPSLVPSKPEQDQIVAMLRTQDAQIARFIKSKHGVIRLLHEQRDAVIRRALTNGVSSDDVQTDQDRWFGAVPAHWQVKKLKHCVRFVGGGTPSKAVDSYWSGSIPWVSPKDMRTDRIIDSQDHISERALRESAVHLVPEGSVLVVVRSGVLRRRIPAAINVTQVTLNQDMKALVPGLDVTARYIRYLIEGFQQSLLRNWSKVGATVESLEHRYIANSLIPVPPMVDQRSICYRLDEELSEINEAIEREKQAIALMLAYRDRQIVDVVTGQIDVRAWQPGPEDLITEDDLTALGGDDDIDTTEEETDGDD
jgi:type I restriction enzyme, S subunit